MYTRIRAPDGAPLLFETYQRSSALISSGRQIWRPFAVALLASLFLLWLIQVPLAWRLARRLQRSQLERERLLVHALEASADERRRIAADLHDGVVQDLAGTSFSLEAAAQDRREPPSPGLRATLMEAATTTRASIRQLRTLLVEIHPPNLALGGLGAALEDLLAPLDGPRDRNEHRAGRPLDLSQDIELVVFGRRRGGQERPASRKGEERHGPARGDRGAGAAAGRRRRCRLLRRPALQRQAEGHVGLALLRAWPPVAAERWTWNPSRGRDTVPPRGASPMIRS